MERDRIERVKRLQLFAKLLSNKSFFMDQPIDNSTRFAKAKNNKCSSPYLTALKKLVLITILLGIITRNSFGQEPTKIILPKLNDEYSKLVAKLESGETDIDYTAFRFSFIESNQYDVKKSDLKNYGSLKKRCLRPPQTQSFQR